MKFSAIYFIGAILISICFLFDSCKKEEKPTNQNLNNLELVWSKTNSETYYHFAGVVGVNSQGNILHYTNVLGVELYELSNPETGNSVWKWSEYVTQNKSQNWENPDNLIFKNDVLILNTGGAIYAVNAISGKTLWVQKLDSMKVTNIKIDNNNDLYIAYKLYQNNNDKITILKTNFNALNWRTVFSINDSASVNDFDCSIDFAQNKNGENMLLFAQNVYYKSSVIYGYNLSLSKTDWITNFEDRHSSYQLQQINCYDKKLFITLNDQENGIFLECIDVNNGQLIWENNYPTLKRDGKIFYFLNNNIIYIGDRIFCINITNGNTLWQTNYMFDPKQVPLFYTSLYKNFLLITTENKLQIMDVLKNEMISNQAIFNYPAQCYSSTFVYPEKKLFYIYNNDKLNCYKAPEIIN